MTLQPIETAPRDGRYILVFGDSGYVTTPMRCEVCRYDAKYHPLQPWANHANDSFEDGGPPALYWAPLPEYTVEQLRVVQYVTSGLPRDFQF